MITTDFLVQFLRSPCTLRACGVSGGWPRRHAYISGGQLKKVEDKLGQRIDDVKGDLGVIKMDVNGLLQIERQKRAVLGPILMNCGKKEWE